MGVIEDESNRKQRRDTTRRIILETIQVAGLFAVALVAPNVVGAMAKLGILELKKLLRG